MRSIPDSMVKPDYYSSIVNLSSWILDNFGVEAPHGVLNLSKGFKKIALIIIDALGAKALEKIFSITSFKHIKEFQVITSVFPSTTACALTSFYTALLPAEHGMLGYILFLKEYGFLVNMIELSPFGYERDLLKDRMEFRLQVKTIFERLENVESFVVSPRRYMNSGLAKMLYAGAKQIGFTSVSDFVLKIRSLLKSQEKRLVVAYIPNVDSVGHRESESSYLNEAIMILKQIDGAILGKLDDDTAVVITADHGMIRTPKKEEIWWDRKSKVMEYLDMPPGGERRMMHLYTRRSQELVEFLESEYSDKGVFLLKEEAKELFGGTHERMGDVVLVAAENVSYNFKYRFKEDSLKGKHGGLSPEEMLVPLIFVPGGGRHG